MASTTREYIDNFSVKDDVINRLIPKYFPEYDINTRTTGMISLVSELAANTTADTFNTGTVYFREQFVNRAQIPESIYSHAAVYQLSDIFSSAAKCSFLLVMEEAPIIENVLSDPITSYDNDSGVYKFYIDKNTSIYVEGLLYTLDYDIVLNIANKGNNNYVFTGNYLTNTFTKNYKMESGYKNSLSDITSSYVKVRRSSDGYLAIEVEAHQYRRDIREETIISNNTINRPVIDIDFDGKLAGFDVLYQDPSWDENVYVQMATQINFSQPIKDPFCYYRMVGENTLRLSFNNKDNFFQAEFNSNLIVILYITEGSGGNFVSYTGDSIEITPDSETYSYPNTYISAATPVSSSRGGRDQVQLDTLQALTIEQYRTATALTTDADLKQFFNIYKYLYGNATVKFLKKRDDVYERVFSAYMIARYNGDTYHTNTLKLAINIDDFTNTETDIYTLDPGYLFTANTTDGYATFCRNEEFYSDFYQEYSAAYRSYYSDTDYVEEDIAYLDEDEVDINTVPPYLLRPISYAGWKARKRAQNKLASINGDYAVYEDRLTVFDLTDDLLAELDNPNKGKFLLMNPFLIRIRKDPTIVSTYMTYVNNIVAMDYMYQNDDSYVQFIINNINISRALEKEKKYYISLRVASTVSIDLDHPLIDGVINPETNDIEYTFNKDDLYKNDLRIIMTIKNDDNTVDVCYTELYPTSYNAEGDYFIFEGEIYTDDHITTSADIRLKDSTIWRDDHWKEVTQTDPDAHKVIPNNFPNTEYNPNKMIYYKEIMEDLPTASYDYNSPSYVKYTKGVYYIQNENNTNFYSKYNPDGELLNDKVPAANVNQLINEGRLKRDSNVYQLSNTEGILIPMIDTVVDVYTLYRRNYHEKSLEPSAIVAPEEADDTIGFLPINPFISEGENSFIKYDKTLIHHIITNKYSTNDKTVDFIKPLNSVRTYCEYKDFTTYTETTTYTTEEDIVDGGTSTTDVSVANTTISYNYDIMDIELSNIGFIRAATFLDKTEVEDGVTKFNYFMNTFLANYNQLVEIINDKLKEASNIDVKFYNTYGRCKNFTIGEENEPLDRVNLSIYFDVWFINGTDTITAIPELKEYIKSKIETLNDDQLNNLYVSNLITDIENNFSYVDHLRFNGINGYESSYQTIKEGFTSLDDLDIEERRFYVPEVLCINTDNIYITEYFV